ncbi:MAG TPA: DUF3014 domain-containing protein [Vicinamibacterales bacterium]
MADLDDFDLNPQSRGSLGPSRSNRALWAIVIVVLIAVAGGVGYFLLRRQTPQAPVTEKTAPAPVAQTPKSSGLTGDNIALPPLPESDPIVRELVSKLSSHPTVLAWLATKGLIANFTVVTHNISEGRAPVAHLKGLGPKGPFRTRGSGGTVSVDPRSYDRYNGYGDAIGALDATGTARLYLTLKPRILDAYGDLGYRGGDFDRVLEKAIGELLDVPVIEGDIPLRQKVISYAYVDEKLESLSPAQKHLMRMGPRNVRIVQAKLREIAALLNLQPE